MGIGVAIGLVYTFGDFDRLLRFHSPDGALALFGVSLNLNGRILIRIELTSGIIVGNIFIFQVFNKFDFLAPGSQVMQEHFVHVFFKAQYPEPER